MMRNNWLRLLAILLAFGLIAAACGDDDDDDTSTEEPAEADDGAAEEPADDGDAEEPADDGAMEEEGDDGAMEEEGDDGAMEEEGGESMVDLASVCPATVVIQSDWFPESEHGLIYHLIGDDYSIDADNKRVSGNMVANGEDLGIAVEVRAGGPAIGSGTVAAEMYVDDSITLGYATTDGQILRPDTPQLSIMAPLEKNPQMIMWDADAYPEIETLADLGEAGVTINIFGGGTFSDVFVALGIWSEDQVDPSYDGSPARFVAAGDIAQQGFASAEPWTYEQLPDYGKQVKFQLLSDAGFPVYSQTLSIRPDDLETLRPCLTELVPIMQAATVDYYSDPAETNALIVEVVEAYDTFWTYPAELAEFSVATQLELGLVGNGPDDTVGNMDEARIQEVIDALTTASMDFPADITPADLVTNEFIDPSIGF